MSQLKVIAAIGCLSLMMVGTASANPWNRHARVYGPPVYAHPPVVVARPPVIVPRPVVVASPVVVAPVAYSAPVYAAPAAPVFAAPAAVYAPSAVYAPPVYGYVVVGPHGRLRMSYVTPGVGLYVRP